MSYILKVCFVINSIFITNVQLVSNCLFSNQKYASPINIEIDKAIPISAGLTLNPDPITSIKIDMEKEEKEGSLRIKLDKTSNQKQTLKMKFLNHEYELQDIYLFWGSVTTMVEEMNSNKKIVDLVADGSEHSIDKKFFPIEVRMVYKPTNTKPKLLGLDFQSVVKVHFLKLDMAKISDMLPDPTINDIIPSKATSVDMTEYVAYKSTIEKSRIRKDDTVLWIISLIPGTIKKEAFQKLYDTYPDLEKRKKVPIQPVCGRKIFKLNK